MSAVPQYAGLVGDLADHRVAPPSDSRRGAVESATLLTES